MSNEYVKFKWTYVPTITAYILHIKTTALLLSSESTLFSGNQYFGVGKRAG